MSYQIRKFGETKLGSSMGSTYEPSSAVQSCFSDGARKEGREHVYHAVIPIRRYYSTQQVSQDAQISSLLAVQ